MILIIMSIPASDIRNFGFLIKDIGRLYTKLFEVEAEPVGVNIAEAKVLAALSRSAGLNQVQLAELSGLEPMSLVRILDRMEADQLIERRAHPTDRRARRIHLKPRAQPTLDAIWKVAGLIRTQALAEFAAEERNALLAQLERVHAKMSDMLSEQGAGASSKVAQSEVEKPTRRRAPARASVTRTGKAQRVTR